MANQVRPGDLNSPVGRRTGARGACRLAAPREDGLGTLNLVTPEKRLEASAAIRSGVAISLGFELRDGVPQPPGSGRMNPQHLMTELPGDAPAGWEGPVFADDMLTMAVHAATHWDALSHCFHGGQMYGGIPAAEVTTKGAAMRS